MYSHFLIPLIIFIFFIFVFICCMVPIGRLYETFLGGPSVRGSGAQVLTRIPFPSVLVHGSSLCTTHVVFDVRPMPGHLQATGCMRWQLDAG